MACNSVGAEARMVTGTLRNPGTATGGGPGSLLDANFVQEVVQLRSLQQRQLAGERAAPLAARAPQSLLSLFR